MRNMALFLSTASLLIASCQPGGHRATTIESPDLRSQEWRQERLDDARIQAKAIRRLALTVANERFQYGGYDTEISDWINELKSEDGHRIADALSPKLYGQHLDVPAELLISLVAPLLSDRGGYAETFWDGPPCGTPSTRLGDISLSAAFLIQDNASDNRDLIPVLTEFALEDGQPQCAAAAAVVRAIAYAAADPEDVELAAVVMFEFASRKPWTPETRSWEKAVKEETCRPREIAARSFALLRDRHKGIEWLDDGHLYASLKGWS